MRFQSVKPLKSIRTLENVTIVRIESPRGKSRQIISETDDGRMFSWSSPGQAYYYQTGYRGDVSGRIWKDRSYHRDYRLVAPVFLHIDTKGPEWFSHPEAFRLMTFARNSPQDPLPRMVLADWFSGSLGEAGQSIGDCLRESLGTQSWAFPAGRFRKELEPITCACKGWPIGRFQFGSDDPVTTLWLSNRKMLGFRIPKAPWDSPAE